MGVTTLRWCRWSGWIGLVLAAAAGPLKGEGGARLERGSPLLAEDSPHLRQYLDSVVEWHPWSDEVFARADRENKALFVSIGYFSCHWCAKMARESFEQPEIGRLLNENFINVKVDRFARPDLDRMYMRYMSETAKKSGWPLNLWMTPNRAPFRGVIFMPSVDKGQGTFQAVAAQAARFWERDSSYLRAQAVDDLRRFSARVVESTAGRIELTPGIFESAFAAIASQFDPVHGGFGRVPKFPSPARLEFLHRHRARHGKQSPRGQECLEMITATLRGMSNGALRDHVAGGFFRYAFDEAWQRPYLEKMALDQAEATRSFLAGHAATGDPQFAAVARETLAYVDRDLAHPEGGFFNATHSESAPEAGSGPLEGGYYVWQYDTLKAAVGDAAPVFEAIYDLKPGGNAPPGSDVLGDLTGWNLLYQVRPIEEAARRLGIPAHQATQSLKEGLAALARERTKRPRPPIDRMVTSQTTGAMISALARAGVILKDPGYFEKARRAIGYVRLHLRDPSNGRLWRWCADRGGHDRGCAEDYASVVEGLLDLYEATGDAASLQWAAELVETMNRDFLDREEGGYFDAARDATDVVAPIKNDDDASSWSSNAVAGKNLARLAAILSRPDYAEMGRKIFEAFGSHLSRNPGVVSGLTCAVDTLIEPLPQVLVVGNPDSDGARRVREAVWSGSTLRRVLVFLDGGPGEAWLRQQVPSLPEFQALPNGETTVYVTSGYAPPPGPTTEAELPGRLEARIR